MTSRERMLAAISCQPVYYTPCSFMIFYNLMTRCATYEEFLARQVEMGLDPFAHAGYLKPAMHPAVTEKLWREVEGGETIICRRLDTPKGPLTQRVAQMNGWPEEDNFWIYHDWVVPRSREVLVKPEQDLEKLPYLLGLFRDEDIQTLRESAKASNALAERFGLLRAGGWGSSYSEALGDDGVMGVDAMSWLSGYVDVMELSLTEPEIIKEYARIIHEWNMRAIGIYLDVADPDIIIRRAWYETTEFWTPGAYREIILPFLKREVETVHQAGKKFGYIITSAFQPLLDDILAGGIDVLIGLDPEEGKGTDLAEVKGIFREHNRAIWGGVSGAITVEQDTEEATEAAVIRALTTLGAGGGFILSPVDNVRDDTPNAWKNTEKFIEVWKQHR